MVTGLPLASDWVTVLFPVVTSWKAELRSRVAAISYRAGLR